MGRGSHTAYVTGFHHALYLGGALAALGAVATAGIVVGRRRCTSTESRDAGAVEAPPEAV